MPNPRLDWGNLFDTTTVTIANGASLSGAANLGGGRLCAIATDAAWDTNSVSFQVSADGVTYYDLYFDNALAGTEYAVTGVVASKFYALQPAQFLAVNYVKVRSGTTGSAVNQNGDTVITLFVELL